MPVVVRLSDTLTISVYGKPREHNPPHFHVAGPDVHFTVRFDSFQVLAGRANRHAFAAAIEWARENEHLLWDTWRQLNERD